jgi:MFS family permease
MIVQAAGVLCGAPFVVLCGSSGTISTLIVALIGWGLFKGIYDANIFASVYDVIPPESRGATAGLMNTVGWLAGGGTAPIVIGWIAQSHGLGYAISLAAGVYLLAGILLLAGVFFTVAADSKRVAAAANRVN